MGRGRFADGQFPGLAILGGYAEAHDIVRVEPASAGLPYDYVVHVLNTYVFRHRTGTPGRNRTIKLIFNLKYK